MRRLGLMAVTALLALAGSASTAVGWQPVETLDLVRGVPAPRVAIDASGKALAVYANSNPRELSFEPSPPGPWIEYSIRPAGLDFVEGPMLMFGGSPDVAVSPAGATAIAAVRDQRLVLTTYGGSGLPTQGRPGAPSTSRAIAEGVPAHAPQVAVDGAGRATVVWSSPAPDLGSQEPSAPPTETFALRPGAAVQKLDTPGNCEAPSLDVNLHGDAAVAISCPGSTAAVFHSSAGTGFGPREEPFEPGMSHFSQLHATVDGAGNVHALQTPGPFGKQGEASSLLYAVRPPSGAFGAASKLAGLGSAFGAFDVEAQEDGRVLLAWQEWLGFGARYSLRPPGGTFAPPRTLGARSLPHGLSLAAAPRGPAVVSWRELSADDFDGVPDEDAQVVASVIGADGAAGPAHRLGIAGDIPLDLESELSVAVNERGQAIAAWEQRCSANGPYGVMAVVLDERQAARPPCQDTRAPKAIAVRDRIALSGRRLRARLACDERCRLTARARVLRAGRRKPLATATTRRETTLAPRRGRWVTLRLSRVGAARVRTAQRAGRKVTVRLAVSVRDVYGTGKVWRLKLPLRR